MVIRVGGAALIAVVVLGVWQPVAARPEYLAKFQADPFRRPEVDGCATCHVNPAGGGARNEFGGAFEAASHDITPLLRAGFPDRFKFETAKMADGSVFLLSDPQSKVVVFERGGQRMVVDVAAISAPKTAPLPPRANRMGFFITSSGLEHGGHVGGLAGADRYCQDLAQAAGAGDRTWHAYLSTSFQGKPAVNAGDRIGTGPWYNAKGELIARGPVDLHTIGRIRDELVLTETGEKVAPGALEIFTGSLPNGSAAVGQTCDNWTRADEVQAVGGDLATSWNSGHAISCGGGTAAKRAPRLYCFAAK